MKPNKLFWELFRVFFRIGLFTFGGGYAMIAIIEEACVEKRRWITREEMDHLIVVAESTPGPIAINCATFVGYRQAGFFGAICATVGMILPSFLVIFAVSRFLDRFLKIPVVGNAFKGIKLAVGILIVDARHNPTNNDCTMADWFKNAGGPFVVVANKLDKLKKSEIQPNLAQIRKDLELPEDCPVIPFSAEKGTGRDELLRAILAVAEG